MSSMPKLSIEIETEVPNAKNETPTPTKLIKHCEEVGLFDFLQKDNPFDQQFKVAAAAIAERPVPSRMTVRPTVFAKQIPSDLNTPQIKPVEVNPTSALHKSGRNKIQGRIDKQHDGKKEITNVHNLEKFESKNTSKRTAKAPNLKISIKSKNTFDTHGEDIKKQIKEKNRAASQRSRQRRKMWVQELETESKHWESLFHTTNKALNEQKKITAFYKGLLQDHIKSASCPERQHLSECLKSVDDNCSIPSSHIASSSDSDQSSSIILCQSGNSKTREFDLVSESDTINFKRKRGRPRKGEERKCRKIYIPEAKPPDTTIWTSYKDIAPKELKPVVQC